MYLKTKTAAPGLNVRTPATHTLKTKTAKITEIMTENQVRTLQKYMIVIQVEFSMMTNHRMSQDINIMMTKAKLLSKIK